MSSALFAKPQVSPEREAYYRRLSAKGTVPLWDVLADLIPHAPRPSAVPALWRFEEMRPLLIEAGGVITAEEAERRVLILENPGQPGSCLITRSLYAGLQLVMPHEIAPTHRHTMSALRFVLEGHGGATTVEGQRIEMHPGDFIVTPSWTSHEHTAGGEPIIWMDGLDIGVVNTFDASFAQSCAPGNSPVTGAHYPYARARADLRDAPVDPRFGARMEYPHMMPAISAFLQLLPTGFNGAPYRATDATVFCVVEGRGSTKAGSETLTWGPRDVFTIPSWVPYSHHASAESVIFSFSDRKAQKALGIWREE